MSESTYGTTLFATSNGSLDIYPDNVASKFTNHLKSEIKLNPDVNYEVRLANLHVPLYETSLIADDFEDSCIKYNIGTFYFDELSEGKYVLNKSTAKTLFTLAPNVNIDGLFDQGDLKKYSFNHTSPDNDIVRDLTGKPAMRSLKESFIHNLGHSLRVRETKPSSPNHRSEEQILAYFKETLLKSDVYANGSNLRGPYNLLGRWFSDLNYFMFSEFSFL